MPDHAHIPTLAAAFLEEFFALHPTVATAIGEHRHDGRWPDVSPTGRSQRLAFIDRWSADLASVDPATLDRDDAVDRDLLLQELAAQRFDERELQEDRWNPLAWVYLLGDGLFGLIARDFSPLAVRLASLTDRLATMPVVLAGAHDALVGADDGRPVGRFQTEKALSQLPGVADLIDEALAEAERVAPEDPPVAAILPTLREAAASAKGSLVAFERHLRDEVLPVSVGDARLGPDLFARKMHHTMRSHELTAERILAAAEREFPAVRAEMARLAEGLWPTWCPGRARPDDETTMVREVLDAIAGEHQEAGDLLDFCRAEHARIEAFCRDHDLIGTATEPLDIRWTPVFLRATGGAMLISPGPLDHGQLSFFAITPMPDEWSIEQRESYLREDNDRMLRLLTIHEATPGHYLQGVYANRSSSVVRAVFASGLFAEGWAVYVTQVMMDAGYASDDPAVMLTHWKFYLRSITNAIIDARIQTMGMTEDEAVRLMVDGGFQEESEARAKVDRARLSSTQLSTYFAGSLEMWEIELEARRRSAEAVGVDRATITLPRPIPGGFGATPGFRYRDHLEAVISHGTPPTSLLRRILFD